MSVCVSGMDLVILRGAEGLLRPGGSVLGTGLMQWLYVKRVALSKVYELAGMNVRRQIARVLLPGGVSRKVRKVLIKEPPGNAQLFLLARRDLF